MLNVKNLYDGFSFDVLGKSVLQSAYSANVPAQKYRDGQSGHPELVSGSTLNNRTALGSEIGTRYRYIDETPLVPMTEAEKSNGTNVASSASGAKTRSRPNNEYVLYSFGEPVAMTNDSGTSYFGTDILGSVRNVTDKYGTVQADYSYDAFGSPYLGNLENDIGFGYCGKVYDIGTGLYDYGFRDYSPVSARFTTVDPIRDGSNWFSYVVNDPVNYVDPLGLESWNNSTLTREEYDKNLGLQSQYSWEQIQQHFADNPNGIIYRYDTISYYLGMSNKDFPNMEKPSFDMVLLLSGFTGVSKTIGKTAINMLKNAFKSSLPAFAVDAFVQTANAAKTGKFEFNVNQSINATTGGFIGGFISGGISQIPLRNGETPESAMLLSNVIGGMSGSMTSQLMFNFQNRQSLETDMRNAWMNGTIGGIMIGLFNIAYPSPLPSNTLQILKDGLKDEIIGTTTTKFLKDSILSNNEINYANPESFQESSNNSANAGNVTFKNINFYGSGNKYIGFKGIPGVCSK